jgi:hypothetical protein
MLIVPVILLVLVSKVVPVDKIFEKASVRMPFELKLLTLQLTLFLFGVSVMFVDYYPPTLKFYLPVSFALIAVANIFSAVTWMKQSTRYRVILTVLGVLSGLVIIPMDRRYTYALAYHEITPAEEKASEAADAKRSKMDLYDGDPKDVATPRTLANVKKYQKEFATLAPVVQILELGKLGGTVGEIPLRHRIRKILSTLSDQDTLVGAGKALQQVCTEQGYDGDGTIDELSVVGSWECVVRASEIKGAVGARILAALKPLHVYDPDEEDGNTRAFLNLELMHDGKPPKYPEYLDE